MKNAFLVAILIAVSIAVFTIFHFAHPVLVLTLGDIFWMILLDVGIAFVLAIYLGEGKKTNTTIFWLIVGSACIVLPIIASVIKYNLGKK